MMFDPEMDRLFLAELESRVECNRRRAGALRFPLLAIAVVNLLAAGWCMLVGRHHLFVFYAPALGVVILTSRHHFRRLANDEGVLLPIRVWVLAACGLAVASAIVSRVGVALEARTFEEVGPSLVWVLGYHALGRWGRNHALVVATIWMVPAAVVVAMFASGDALVAGLLTTNGVLLGVAARMTSEVAP